jgi:AcrR family transcriptional regulator
MTSQTSASLSPRAERTRAVLIAAGFDLLVERPIDGIPIDEIVAKAGVGKGSFFNHFKDKRDFESAVANAIRRDIESRVSEANAGIDDPILRLIGGMRVAASFAMERPKSAAILMRNTVRGTGSDHPLNMGLRADINAAYEQGMIRPEASRIGVLYWLGLCQILMANLIEAHNAKKVSEGILHDMLTLGLAGLGVRPEEIVTLIERSGA